VTERPDNCDSAAAAAPRATKKKPAKTRGLGRIYQRGEIWWVQYYFHGRLYRESSGSTVQARATDLLKRRLAEMGRGRLLGPTIEKTTFETLAQMLFVDYEINGRKSLDRAKRSVVHLREFFGLSRAIDITPDRVSAYISSRMAVAKPATIRNELAALKRMFTLGERAGKVSHRPRFPSIEVRNTRSGFFEDAELRAVLRELPADLRVLIEFVHLSGWRIGEAKQLTWRQVDLRAGTVRLEPGTTKNDEGRTLPFGGWPRLNRLMLSQREHTSALEREQGRLIPWVFHRNGKPILSFHEAWRNACKRARVPGRLVHDLRRTAVRNFERAGVARSVAMKLSGHKTESIYTRYAIVSEADLAEGIRKVAGLSGDVPDDAERVTHASRGENS
jgi:integrase